MNHTMDAILRLSGRRVVITGAAQGIGLATARLFKSQGASLALLDRNAALVNAVAQELGAWACACDIQSFASVQFAVAKAAQHLGGLDGLVNCAGIVDVSPIDELSAERWLEVVSINLSGTFYAAKAALPWLRQNPTATIVNVASAQALHPTGVGLAYGASKGGVVTLSKALAVELAPQIRVNVICPGATDTPMAQGVAQDEAVLARAVGGGLIKRLSTADEQAYAILFLTSHESSFVDGVALATDGGRTRH